MLIHKGAEQIWGNFYVALRLRALLIHKGAEHYGYYTTANGGLRALLIHKGAEQAVGGHARHHGLRALLIHKGAERSNVNAFISFRLRALLIHKGAEQKMRGENVMNDYLSNLANRIQIDIDSVTNYNYLDTAVIILRNDVNELIKYAKSLQEENENYHR